MNMVKDPNCLNKNWKRQELDDLIYAKVRAVLHSPELAADIAANRPQPVPIAKNVDIERRIREIDKQIAKLMELYQRDGIPPELLGENINKLYAEKTALQESVVPEKVPDTVPFDLARELLADAAQVWDYADDDQRRRILQSLITRITLTDDKDPDIEWAF